MANSTSNVLPSPDGLVYSYPLVYVGLGVIVRDLSSMDNVGVDVREWIKIFRGGVIVKVVSQCVIGNG